VEFGPGGGLLIVQLEGPPPLLPRPCLPLWSRWPRLNTEAPLKPDALLSSFKSGFRVASVAVEICGGAWYGKVDGKGSFGEGIVIAVGDS
jgi:hypothetical protein